jgi:uncharacterized protein YjbI with pentapeptide repeats
MVTLRIVSCGVFLLLLSATAHGEKPTREDVIAYVDECTNERQKMDLIARFGTDFSGLDLRHVNFRGHNSALGTNLRGADFTDANLTGADFYDSILDGADFTGADLTDAYLNWASLRSATLQNVQVTGASFSRCNFAEAKMAGLDLSQSDMGDFWPVNFQNADLTGADLHGLTLAKAIFQDANLRGANLRGCQLEQANFTGADLQGTDLENAYLVGAVFRDVQGLSDAETRKLTAAAGRWRFLLKTYLGAFLDSCAFPVLLLLVAPLVVIVARRRRKRAPPDASARFQFSLWSMLLLTAIICSFIGFAVVSLTGAYSYAMVGAFYMMVAGLLERTGSGQAEVVRGRASRKFSVGLLTTALVCVPLNLAGYFAVAALIDPFFLFDQTFMIAVVFVGPALAIGGAIVAAIIVWRANKRVPTLSLVGFGIWMAGVGSANVWLIDEIAAGV